MSCTPKEKKEVEEQNCEIPNAKYRLTCLEKDESPRTAF
jgi:hypothetical protein